MTEPQKSITKNLPSLTLNRDWQLKPEPVRHAESPPQAERNKAAKKHHKEFAVLNFESKILKDKRQEQRC